MHFLHTVPETFIKPILKSNRTIQNQDSQVFKGRSSYLGSKMVASLVVIFKILWDIAGNARKSLRSLWKCSEVVGNSSGIHRSEISREFSLKQLNLLQ